MQLLGNYIKRHAQLDDRLEAGGAGWATRRCGHGVSKLAGREEEGVRVRSCSGARLATRVIRLVGCNRLIVHLPERDTSLACAGCPRPVTLRRKEQGEEVPRTHVLRVELERQVHRVNGRADRTRRRVRVRQVVERLGGGRVAHGRSFEVADCLRKVFRPLGRASN
jgi:hypothetical protein